MILFQLQIIDYQCPYQEKFIQDIVCSDKTIYLPFQKMFSCSSSNPSFYNETKYTLNFSILRKGSECAIPST